MAELKANKAKFAAIESSLAQPKKKKVKKSKHRKKKTQGKHSYKFINPSVNFTSRDTNTQYQQCFLCSNTQAGY